jgi:putative DNA primase/helicase
MKNYPPPTPEEIETALAHVPNHDRELWLRMGMAVRAELGDDGFCIWDAWSWDADNYNEPDAKSVWKSFKGNGVTISSLFSEARSHGYKPEVTREIDPGEISHREAACARSAEETKREQAKDKARRKAGAAKAQRLWDAATPEMGTHRYLVDKCVQAHGVRTDGHKLLVPIRDVDHDLHGIERVWPNGDKKFTGATTVGGHYFGIGKPGGRLIVAEGFATAASIHEATGDAVAVAFDCGNLKPVALALRAKFPDIEIIIAADDDIATVGNPGRTKANQAAQAVNGLVSFPDFGNNRPHDVSDFNDLAKHRGPEVVAAQIVAAVPPQDDTTTTVELYPRITLARASSIEMEHIEWLWRDYLAQGVLTMLAGKAGTGKTTLALNLAAIVTVGGTWPDGTRAPCGDVLMWTGEDGIADTIVPRLAAAGADRDRVHLVRDVTDEDGKRPFDPATDLVKLKTQLAFLPAVRMLIVDPVVSAVSGDSHKNAETRKGLQPLVDIAQIHGIAVVGITHFTKNTKGRDPAERVTGSLAFGAVSRMLLVTAEGKEEDDPNVLTRAKSNIGPTGGGFEYSLNQVQLPNGIVASVSRWGAPLEGTALSILGACETNDDYGSPALDDATYFLKQELTDGPVDVEEIKRRSAKAGHSWRTIRRAQSDLGIKPKPSGFGRPWRWELPDGDATVVQTNDVGQLCGEQPLKPAPDKVSTSISQGSDELANTDEISPRVGQTPETLDNSDETLATQGFEGDPPPRVGQAPVFGQLRVDDDDEETFP